MIADQNLVERMNKRRLLQKVLDHSPISRANPAKMTGLNITSRLRQNDPLLLQSLKNFGHYLGIGPVNVINTFDPEAIILRNPLIESNPFVLNTVKHTLSSLLNIWIDTRYALLSSTLSQSASAWVQLL
ncbi:ROK family protein [Domibacillus robiginosus]|uniref:ROK family protein n=1 Tax=Domibacillus robiginosus TaxID=1071054 RepID=UPI00067B9043|nr:ROK family protein [Domibacillus robiginosus]